MGGWVDGWVGGWVGKRWLINAPLVGNKTGLKNLFSIVASPSVSNLVI